MYIRVVLNVKRFNQTPNWLTIKGTLNIISPTVQNAFYFQPLLYSLPVFQQYTLFLFFFLLLQYLVVSFYISLLFIQLYCVIAGRVLIFIGFVVSCEHTTLQLNLYHQTPAF